MRWILINLNSEFHAMLSSTWCDVKSTTPCDGNNILFFFTRTGRPNHRLTQWMLIKLLLLFYQINKIYCINGKKKSEVYQAPPTIVIPAIDIQILVSSAALIILVWSSRVKKNWSEIKTLCCGSTRKMSASSCVTNCRLHTRGYTIRSYIPWKLFRRSQTWSFRYHIHKI